MARKEHQLHADWNIQRRDLCLSAEADAQGERNEVGVGGIAEDRMIPAFQVKRDAGERVVDSDASVDPEVCRRGVAEKIGVLPDAPRVVHPCSADDVRIELGRAGALEPKDQITATVNPLLSNVEGPTVIQAQLAIGTV